MREFNLATSSEDIARFVVAVNINKIATDHPEYISQYVDETNTDEFMQDVYQTLMDIITYNGNIYAKEGNTDHFIMADEAIFDEYSRDMLIEIENYFDELASETDDEKFNIKVDGANGYKPILYKVFVYEPAELDFNEIHQIKLA